MEIDEDTGFTKKAKRTAIDDGSKEEEEIEKVTCNSMNAGLQRQPSESK